MGSINKTTARSMRVNGTDQQGRSECRGCRTARVDGGWWCTGDRTNIERNVIWLTEHCDDDDDDSNNNKKDNNNNTNRNNCNLNNNTIFTTNLIKNIHGIVLGIVSLKPKIHIQ